MYLKTTKRDIGFYTVISLYSQVDLHTHSLNEAFT